MCTGDQHGYRGRGCVVNPTGEGAKKSRVSLPLFLHPREDVVLSDRYTAHEYLEERLRELGVKA